MMSRIDWEYDEYLGAGEYETRKYYEYVLGHRMLGKAIYEGMKNEGDQRPAYVWKLSFSPKGLWVCATRTTSSQMNLTKSKAKEAK